MSEEKWMAGATNPGHEGELRALVMDRYGEAGFEPSPRTGKPIIRLRVLRELRKDRDPHVRGMADFAYNARMIGAARRTADRHSPLSKAAAHLGRRS